LAFGFLELILGIGILQGREKIPVLSSIGNEIPVLPWIGNEMPYPDRE
jgi:hypothetical protein